MLDWLGVWADGWWNWAVISLFLVLAGWETLRPAREPASSAASRWFTNISLYAVNASLVALFVPAALVALLTAHLGPSLRPFALLNEVAGGWPVLFAGILFLDLYAYTIHRVEHHFFVLWRFHSVHHSDVDMDASTTLRHHPVEYLVSSVVGALTFALLAIPEWVFPVYALVGIVISLVQHVNARLPAGVERVLGLVFITPGLHQIHHSVAAADCSANYGTVFSVWDRLFRTYRREPEAGQANLAFGVPPFTLPEYSRLRWAWMLPFALRRDADDGLKVGEAD